MISGIPPPPSAFFLQGVASPIAIEWYRYFVRLGQIVGSLGTFVSSPVESADAVSLTTGVPATVGSIDLPPGDWDVTGTVYFSPNLATVISAESAGLSTVAATLPTPPAGGSAQIAGLVQVAGTAISLPLGTVRLSLTAPTTVYLVAQASFTVSTCGAYGIIQATQVG